jgi:hypothetical protein
MAKSEISMIYVRQALENLVCQRTDPRENDFAISIAFGDMLWWVKSTPSDEAIHARGWKEMTVFDQSHSRKGAQNTDSER